MPNWLDWFALAFSLGLMAAALFNRQGGSRLALVAAILATTSASRLVPDSIRPVAWAVAGLLLLYAFVTTPRATYRKLRVELSLAAAAVAVIAIIELTPGLPRPVMMALLVILVVLIAAFAVLGVARSIGRTL